MRRTYAVRLIYVKRTSYLDCWNCCVLNCGQMLVCFRLVAVAPIVLRDEFHCDNGANDEKRTKNDEIYD